VYRAQRSIVHHLQEIVSAYLRLDPIPQSSADYIDRTHAIVAAAWDEIAAQLEPEADGKA
jgi:hypothetical protein